MRSGHVRFTIRRLMTLVALLGLASALFRVHPSLAALAAGVSTLILLRTCEKVDRSSAAGRPMGRKEVVAACLDSVVVAFTILGASLLPAAGIVPVCHSPGFLLPGPPAIDPTAAGVLLSAFAGIPIAYLLRRKMW